MKPVKVYLKRDEMTFITDAYLELGEFDKSTHITLYSRMHKHLFYSFSLNCFFPIVFLFEGGKISSMKSLLSKVFEKLNKAYLYLDPQNHHFTLNNSFIYHPLGNTVINFGK